MGRRCAFLTFGVLASLILILVSCASGTTTTTAPQTTSVAPATTSAAPPTTKPSADKPQYGGEFTVALTSDTQNWDATQLNDLRGFQITLMNETMHSGDWAKGPAGTGQTDWQYGCIARSSMTQGLLAESWEILDNETIVWHIRHGVKWWNKPPANGREFTAADAAWNLNKQWSRDFKVGNFYNSRAYPSEWLVSATATDKYTLVEKVALNAQGLHFWESGGRAPMMLPELYPQQSDWHYALGTGAFMVTDYVLNSSMTMVRNPNYWQTDPVGPGKGNQLPYLDKLTFVVIPDASTRYAAFRIGKIDKLDSLTYDDYTALSATMKWKPGFVQTFGANMLPMGREDKANLPFKDVKVRQAMNLAIDKQTIVKDYYQGHAELMGWPYYPTPTYSDLYTPLDQMATNVQELVKGGNPTKAKQLLTEAGYPNGFKTSIVCSTASEEVDFLSIIKEQLSKVGIDMTIKPTEPAVLSGVTLGRTYDEMIYKATKQYFLPHSMTEMRPESQDCGSFWSSPQTTAIYNSIQTKLAIDDQAWRAPLKEVTPFVLEQSFAIWVPVAYKYNIWQPWVKNYYGCSTMAAFMPHHAQEYTWVDQTVKKSILQ